MTNIFVIIYLLLFLCSSSSPGLHHHSCYPGCHHQWWSRYQSPPPGHHQTPCAQADRTGEEASGAPCSSNPPAYQRTDTGSEERALQDRIHWQHQVPARWRKGRPNLTHQATSMNYSEQWCTCQDPRETAEWFSCISKWFDTCWFVIQIAAMCCIS